MKCDKTIPEYKPLNCRKFIKRVPRKLKKMYTKIFRKIYEKNGFTYKSFGKVSITT